MSGVKKTLLLEGTEDYSADKITADYKIYLRDESNANFGKVFGTVSADDSSRLSADEFMFGSSFVMWKQANADLGKVSGFKGHFYDESCVSIGKVANGSDIGAYGSSKVFVNSVTENSFFYLSNEANVIIKNGFTNSEIIAYDSSEAVIFGSVDGATFSSGRDDHIYLCDHTPDKLDYNNFVSSVIGNLHHPGFLGGDQGALEQVCSQARERIEQSTADVTARGLEGSTGNDFNAESGALVELQNPPLEQGRSLEAIVAPDITSP